MLAVKRGARIRTPSGDAISSTIFLSFFPPPFFVHVGPVQTTILSRLLAFIMSEAGAARRCTDCDTHAPGLRSAGFDTVAKPAAPPHISAIAAARRPILSWCPAAGQKSNSLLVTPVSIIQANGTAEEAGRRRLEGLRRPAPALPLPPLPPTSGRPPTSGVGGRPDFGTEWAGA